MVVHLHDHHLMTTSALDAIVDIIAIALEWCRNNSFFINFCAHTNLVSSLISDVSPQSLSYINCVMSALEFIECNVQRSIKSDYLLCNAFLADDTNVRL